MVGQMPTFVESLFVANDQPDLSVLLVFRQK